MTHDPHAQAGHHDSETLAHPLPLGLLAGIFAALLVLTFITVAVTWVDLGVLNIWIALLIAVIKGGLVVLYFMHLRYDSPLNGVVLVTSLLFLAIFIGGAITDSGEYQPNLEPPATVQPAP